MCTDLPKISLSWETANFFRSQESNPYVMKDLRTIITIKKVVADRCP